jgi:AcrR family transcriptional regulator
MEPPNLPSVPTSTTIDNVGTVWYRVKGETKTSPKRPKNDDETTHGRILHAAFAAFAERGYAETTTLDIAQRARVSKRALYALVGNKQELLLACIRRRAQRLEIPPNIPTPRDRTALAGALQSFGVGFLREVSAPTVVAVFRIAIAEAERAPDVARALDHIGREAGRSTLRELLEQARSSGLIDGDPSEVAEQFTALLWGDLLVNLLLRVADPPSEKEMERRGRLAADAVLRLYSTSLKDRLRDAGARRMR